MAIKKTVLLGVTHFQSTGFFRGFIDVLRARGAEVHVVSAAPAAEQGAEHLRGARLHELPMAREINPVQDISSLLRWFRLMQKIRPDIVAVGTPKAGLLGTIAAWLLRVPKRVYVVRGLRLETETGIKRRVLLAMERLSARLATDVQFVSPSLMEVCLALNIGTRAKSVVIGKGSSNGIDLQRFSKSSVKEEEITTLRSELKIDSKIKTIGFIGRLVVDKGINTLVAAIEALASEHKELQLLLIGPAEDTDFHVDVSHLESLGVRVIMTGAVSDTRPYYCLMDVFVLPTLREGFPNVALEARAMQVPVVTTNATGAIDSVDRGALGFVANAGDSDSLATEIMNALKLAPAEREDLIARSLADLEAHYKRTEHQQKIANYYLR